MNENSYLNEESRSGPAGISGFMLGAIFGAGVALLFAPATGNDTRRRLGDTARRLGTAARDKFNEGKDTARDYIESKRHGDEGRQGFEAGARTGGETRPNTEARREPVPSTPGQTGSRTTPGKTGTQGSTYTP